MQRASTSACAVSSQGGMSQDSTQYKQIAAGLPRHDEPKQHATLPSWKQLHQAQHQQELTAHPVPVNSDAPAGKLHKSLLSQVLAALATCRKLPPGYKHREELDQLLQHALALAHEAVVAWSAAAVAQLEPQQQQQEQATKPQQEQQQQQQKAGKQGLATSVQQHQALVTTCPQQQGKQVKEEKRELPTKAQQCSDLVAVSHYLQQQQQEGATNVPAAASSAPQKREKRVTWHAEPTICLIPAPSDTPSVVTTDKEDAALTAATKAACGSAPVAVPVAAAEATAIATAVETAPSSEQLAAFVEGIDLGPLLEFSWASKWSRSTSSCDGSTDVDVLPSEQYHHYRQYSVEEDGQNLQYTPQHLQDEKKQCKQYSPLPQQQQHAAALTNPEQQQQGVRNLLTSEDECFLPCSSEANGEQHMPSRPEAARQMQQRYTKAEQTIRKQQKEQHRSPNGEQEERQLLTQQQKQQDEQYSHNEEDELEMFRRYSRSLGGCDAPRQYTVQRRSSCPLQLIAPAKGTAGTAGGNSRCQTAAQTICEDLPMQVKHDAASAAATAGNMQDSLILQTPCVPYYDAQGMQVSTRLHDSSEPQQTSQPQPHKQQQQWQLEQPLKQKGYSLDTDEQQPASALDTAWSIGSAWQADVSSGSVPAAPSACAADPEVQLLVDTLSSGDKVLQRAAANTLMNLAFNCAETRAMIAAAGAIAPLVGMLDSCSRSCQVSAAGALSNLCIDNADNQAAIAQLGGVQLLCNLLSSSSTSVQRAAARALNNLAWELENRYVIAAAGGIPQLVQLLSSDCPDVQEHAAATLMNLARDVVFGIPVAIAEAGGIPALIGLLDGRCGDDVQDSAAGALMNLAYSTPGNRAAIAAAGGITSLITLLTGKNKSVQRSAAGALKNLLRDSPDNQAAVAEAGGIPVLAWILKGSRGDVKLEAAGALWNLIHNNPENQAELAAAGGFQPLMALMDQT